MSNKKKINVWEIIDFFSLKLINSNPEEIEYSYISQPAIKRVGLELSELIINERLNRNVISWGTSESIWFQSIGKQRAKKAISHIFSQKPPLVILSKGVTKPALYWINELADEYKIPVALVEVSSSFISTNIGAYLNNYFAEQVQVHGCLVLVKGTGVLIIGQSGVGKSEAALELVQKGHVLISDDSVLISDGGNLFIGRPPKITQNILEVRGIGMIDVKYIYGVNSVASSSVIDLVVELVQANKQNELDRLGIEFLKYPILGRYINKIQIPIKGGGSSAALIEAAVGFYLSKQDGLNVIETIEKRRLSNE
ncbi:HPr(Ser) kinase/phosphatase [Mycoplasma leonicaptivi]|uniref:HPr(Ser) kinase/phosphatase n=1 Tax=Mycoplasma leonicaptivi TaxID=36742 RepID=UPI0004832A2D|nr:HPr(Ser) kinase/phosphatase [Mycoplasma leonicaptivi]